MKEIDDKPAFEKKLPKKLVTLLRKTQAFILENPKNFDMGEWAKPDETGCGTVACICGRMALLDTSKKVQKKVKLNSHKFQLAWKDYLKSLESCSLPVFEYSFDKDGPTLSSLVTGWKDKNIPEDFAYNFSRLFFSENWPRKFLTHHGNVTPKLASKRIDYFLRTGL